MTYIKHQIHKTWFSNLSQAMDKLFDMFPDHYPRLVGENSDCWELVLEWPSTEAWFVDPALPIVAGELYELNLSNIAPFYRVDKWNDIEFIFSMFHSRALLAPTRAAQVLFPEVIKTIVHVDFHSDLMPCLVQPANRLGSLMDSYSAESINLYHWDSVLAGIERGTINKGNFLSTYILAYPVEGNLIHVSAHAIPGSSYLEPQPYISELGDNQYIGYAINPVNDTLRQQWLLTETPRLPKKLDMVTNTQYIWLDIDLDFFCNRYDGDSDRKDLAVSDLERKETYERVSEFLTDLKEANWLAEIKAISIAVSPAFFPSDYWTDLIPRICNEIKDTVCL